MKAKSFRDFLNGLDKKKKLIKIKKKVSRHLEAAGVLKALDGNPVMLEDVAGSEYRVAGNVFSTRELVAECLGVKKEELVAKMMDGINNPTKPKVVERKMAPVLEVEEKNVDLSRLPVLFHCEKDGGPYFSSAVVVAKDPELGHNCSFHRLMVIEKDKVVARILQRHLDEFIKRAGGELDVAIVVGAPVNFLLGAATSVKLGQNEMEIANSLMPLEVVELENGIQVPAHAEFVFEARITDEMHDEGPFVDLTETYDIVRKQRVVKINKIYHRKNPIYHALLPGGLEHKILMGMPREPTIFNEVSKVVECKGVNITPGGCSWLHAVVSIKKKNPDDGKKAIEAAFSGHKSLKHVVVVDDDIDIYDPNEVEWAIATRFQADKNLVIKPHEKGSSLDPSADPNTYETTKAGVDATKPLVVHGKNFEKARYKRVDVKKYL